MSDYGYKFKIIDLKIDSTYVIYKIKYKEEKSTKKITLNNLESFIADGFHKSSNGGDPILFKKNKKK